MTLPVGKTGGRWDPSAWPVYFIASDIGTLNIAYPANTHLLVAVNELKTAHDITCVVTFCAAGRNVFIDSGVFALSTQHAQAHGLTMDEALALDPDQVDGFDALLEKYVGLVHDLGDKVWGYIEVDQGGRENKIKTRAKLEGMGLRPIPVYHPFNDGWDYFDYLAERYDRICFGNVVQADTPTRKRLVATAWERRRKYPNLWIHLLGLTPSAITNAYPMNSCDSSSWLAGVRWTGGNRVFVASKHWGDLDPGFRYNMNAEPAAADGHKRARRLAAYESEMLTRSMGGMADEQLAAIGADIVGAV